MKNSSKFFKKIILPSVALTALLIANFASAQTMIDGKVVSVRVDSNGAGIVAFEGNKYNDSPSCIIPAYIKSYAFNTNTEGGKAILAASLAAKATRAPVRAYGLGTCAIYGGAYVEDIFYFQDF